MTTLSDLPAELHHQIGLHIFDPLHTTPHDRLSGNGIFNAIDKTRAVDRASLVAFASTSKAIRSAVEPLIFARITVRTMKGVRTVADAGWRSYVKILRLQLDRALHIDWRDYNWDECDPLVRLLQGLNGLQHLYISIAAHGAAQLEFAIGQLLAPAPGSPHSEASEVSEASAVAGGTGLLERVRSFALDTSQERHDTKPILAAVEPLLAAFANLDFLLLKCYNAVDRTRSRPRVLPLLARVTSTVRALNLTGCWQERDDDLLRCLPPALTDVEELFLLHGCDHTDHGQWRENAVTRLGALPNLHVVVWEIEAFWQPVVALAATRAEERYVLKLAGTLDKLSVVGFSGANYLEHTFGIHRHDGSYREKNDSKVSLLPVEFCNAEVVAGLLASPCTRARKLRAIRDH